MGPFGNCYLRTRVLWVFRGEDERVFETIFFADRDCHWAIKFSGISQRRVSFNKFINQLWDLWMTPLQTDWQMYGRMPGLRKTRLHLSLSATVGGTHLKCHLFSLRLVGRGCHPRQKNPKMWVDFSARSLLIKPYMTLARSQITVSSAFEKWLMICNCGLLFFSQGGEWYL